MLMALEVQLTGIELPILSFIAGTEKNMNELFKRSTRMTTGVERVFRPTPHGDGLYRELFLHWIHFLDPATSVIISSKLDKTIEGKLFKIAGAGERSPYGEVEYKFPNSEEPVRLVALGLDYNDERYGRY